MRASVRTGNAALLAFWAFAPSNFTLRLVVRGVIALEWLGVMGNNCLYIRKVRRFNATAPLADPIRILQNVHTDTLTAPGESAGAAGSGVTTADLVLFWQQRAEDLQNQVYRLQEYRERAAAAGAEGGSGHVAAASEDTAVSLGRGWRLTCDEFGLGWQSACGHYTCPALALRCA